MAFLDFLTGRTLRDENETLRARVAYLRADNERLATENAARKQRVQECLALLHMLAEHLETCPPGDPADRLLGDLKADTTTAAPVTPGTADPTTPATERPSS